MLSLDEETRKSVQANAEAAMAVFASIPGGEQVGEAFGQIISGLPAAGTEFGQQLARIGAHQEMAALEELGRQVRNGEISKEQAQQQSLNILGSIKDNESFRQQLMVMARSQDEGAKSFAGFIGNLQGADMAAVRTTSQDGTTKDPTTWVNRNKFGTIFDLTYSQVLSDPPLVKQLMNASNTRCR